MRSKFIVGLVLLAVVGGAGCSVVRDVATVAKNVAWRTFTAEGRIQRKARRAHTALDAKQYDRAAALYSELRAKQPDSPDFALGHACALVPLGRTEEAWSALDAAAGAGLYDVRAVKNSSRLAPLRADPRFQALLARTRENLRALSVKFADAKRPAPLSSAPSFDSWDQVEQSVERENRKIEKLTYRRDWFGAAGIEYARLRQANLAKIRRYLADHPDAPDREQALVGELSERVSIADRWSARFSVDEGAAIVEAADAFLAAYPASASRSTVELQKAVAAMCGVLPATGRDPEREDAYPFDCERATPMLEALAAKAPGDPRGIEATGLLAVCLWEGEPRDAKRALAVAESFLAHAEDGIEDDVFYVDGAVRKVRLLAGPLPAFEAKDLAGKTWTPEVLKGNVSVLQFWSPG